MPASKKIASEKSARRVSAKVRLRKKITKSSVTDESSPAGSPWGSPPTSSGRRTKRIQPTDDRTTRELVEEGVDEAERDLMLRAQRARK
jgi:hypothetical protein